MSDITLSEVRYELTETRTWSAKVTDLGIQTTGLKHTQHRMRPELIRAEVVVRDGAVGSVDVGLEGYSIKTDGTTGTRWLKRQWGNKYFLSEQLATMPEPVRRSLPAWAIRALEELKIE